MLHMAWANQEIFNEIAKLPDAALEAYVTNEEWQVSVILLHIAKAADSYGCRINGTKFSEFDFPEKMSDIKKLAEKTKNFDTELLNLDLNYQLPLPHLRDQSWLTLWLLN